MPRLLPVLLIPLLLGGCALPLPVQIASLAIDGFLYLTTEKSLTDHGISVVSGQDCALHRIVTSDGAICDEVAAEGIAVAEAASEQKPEVFVDEKQIETIPWDNNGIEAVALAASVLKVETVALAAPVQQRESKPKSAGKTLEVVDLWSHDVPDSLLPEGSGEEVAALPVPEASMVPGVLGVLSLSEMSSLQPQDQAVAAPPVPEIPKVYGVLGVMPLSELEAARLHGEQVNLWSSDVPDHLINEVNAEPMKKRLYLAEANYVY